MTIPRRMLLVILVALLCAVAGPAFAAGRPDPDRLPGRESIRIRMDVVNLTAEGAARISPSDRLPATLLAQMVAQGQSRVVQSLEMLTMSDADARLLVGRKDPIVYYDAKASQFQIQYVDTGIKLVARTSVTSGGTLRMEIGTEIDPLESLQTYTDPVGKTTYPQTTIETTRTTINGVRSGESVIVSQTQGALVPMLLKMMNVPILGNHLVVLITPTRGARVQSTRGATAPSGTGNGAATRDDRSCRIEFQLLRVPSTEPSLAHVTSLGRAELERLVRERRIEVVEAASVVGRVGNELARLGGRKVPIGYTDPRTGGHQVQYIDVGFKAVADAVEYAADMLRVNVNLEKLELEGPDTKLPAVRGMAVQSQILLRPDQVCIVASTRGHMTARALNAADASAVYTPGDTLLFALSIRMTKGD